MTTSGESSTSLRRSRRRRRRRCLIGFGVLFLLLLALILTLSLTVFRFRETTSELLSARVTGASPRISLPALRFDLNLTISLEIRVHNPNYASFSHAPGVSLLSYRGAQVGDADVAPGKIPARGSEIIRLDLVVQVDRIAAELPALVADVAAGEVGFDASTTIPGRVAFLGTFKRHAVSFSQCHVVFGFPDLKLRGQECRRKTKFG